MRWVTRDGERALAVVPAPQTRRQPDGDALWRVVLAAAPDADTPGMRDQLVCHAAFAPDKATWHLEPRRPAVGLAETVRAGCNPGAVRDPDVPR